MKPAVKCEGRASASPAVQTECESVRRGERPNERALRCGCTLNVQIRHACCCVLLLCAAAAAAALPWKFRKIHLNVSWIKSREQFVHGPRRAARNGRGGAVEEEIIIARRSARASWPLTLLFPSHHLHRCLALPTSHHLLDHRSLPKSTAPSLDHLGLCIAALSRQACQQGWPQCLLPSVAAAPCPPVRSTLQPRWLRRHVALHRGPLPLPLHPARADQQPQRPPRPRAPHLARSRRAPLRPPK